MAPFHPNRFINLQKSSDQHGSFSPVEVSQLILDSCEQLGFLATKNRRDQHSFLSLDRLAVIKTGRISSGWTILSS
jgi:hypothetical protein